jgi:hypothetical protein
VWVGAIAVALAGVAAVAIPPREDVVPDSVSLRDLGEQEGGRELACEPDAAA